MSTSCEDGFYEVEAFALFMITVVVIGLGYGLVMGVYDLCCRPEPTARDKWVATQEHRCQAMRFRLTVSSDDPNTVECYRTPLLRRPKLEFKETFKQ